MSVSSFLSFQLTSFYVFLEHKCVLEMIKSCRENLNNKIKKSFVLKEDKEFREEKKSRNQGFKP